MVSNTTSIDLEHANRLLFVFESSPLHAESVLFETLRGSSLIRPVGSRVVLYQIILCSGTQ